LIRPREGEEDENGSGERGRQGEIGADRDRRKRGIKRQDKIGKRGDR